MSVYASRSNRRHTAAEVHQLVRDSYAQLDQLIAKAFDDTLRYYCTVDESAHRAVLRALKKAQNIIVKLRRIQASGSAEFKHYYNELARARQYLKDKKKYLALPDYGSLISGDPECRPFE